MLTLLGRLLILVAVIFVIRAVLAMILGSRRTRHRAGPSRPGEPEAKKMVKDPVCGMYMDPRLALRLQSKSGDFYFCSEECRRKFVSGTSAHP